MQRADPGPMQAPGLVGEPGVAVCRCEQRGSSRDVCCEGANRGAFFTLQISFSIRGVCLVMKPRSPSLRPPLSPFSQGGALVCFRDSFTRIQAFSLPAFLCNPCRLINLKECFVCGRNEPFAVTHGKYFLPVQCLFAHFLNTETHRFYKVKHVIFFLNDICFHVILRLFPVREFWDSLCALLLALTVT